MVRPSPVSSLDADSVQRLVRPGSLGIRGLVRGLITALAQSRRQRLTRQELEAAAIVFAPHQDDETLGCGGTILLKRKAGAHVTVVFMTDGSMSHRRLVPARQLSDMRAAEARAACGRLGVGEEAIFFMKLPDGDLAAHHDDGVQLVSALLETHHVDQVFIPYLGDDTPDHQATRRIVLAALKRRSAPMVVFEYPVWFWLHWPWVSVERSTLSTLVQQTLRTLVSSLRLVTDLRCRVSVGQVLCEKETALKEHATQTARLRLDEGWPVLADIADGEFLQCCFQPNECFYRHQV